MKFLFSWNDSKEKELVEIISHSQNKQTLVDLVNRLNQSKTLTCNHPSSNRKQAIPIQDIESIISLGHVSKVILTNQDYYFYPKRLKELVFLEAEGLYQINQSTIINLEYVQQFQSEKHARLELTTTHQNNYVVSRHYAKNIKEKLQ